MIGVTLCSMTLVLAATGAPHPHAAPPAGDFSYTFTVNESNSSKTTSGTVRSHGDRTRIDLANPSDGQYMLLVDGGARMLVIHPEKKEIDQFSSPGFANVIGTALGAVSPMVRFTVTDSKITPERLGAGETVLGYPTEHVRITEQFDVRVGVAGFKAGTEHNTVTTDYWVSPGLDLGDNPLITLIENASSAMAQSDHDFVAKQHAARAGAIHGTPLRTVVTAVSGSGDGHEKTSTQTIEITSVKRAPQPESLFVIPSGYKLETPVESLKSPFSM